MGNHYYEVILTNGVTQQKYQIPASCERAAIILAQAKAIYLARGYDLVNIKCR